jgi:predicted O-methyltransferase YrrM
MTVKKTLQKLYPLIDVALLVPLVIAAPIFKTFAKIGGSKLPKCREYLKSAGIYPILDHYYQPLFRDSRLKKSLKETRLLPGIDWKIDSQLSFLDALRFENELLDMNLYAANSDPLKFSLFNGSFESGDAEFLYQMVRYLRPQNIIEIGSGYSTKIAHEALKRNYAETGLMASHICIEPYEMPWLEKLGVNVQRKLVECCDLGVFQQLKSNDLLFIDSSHMIRPQGDVLFEFLELIPTLQKGVIVHVHDIFSPRDYLEDWVRKDVRFWNEQYLLEALLTDTNKYEIVAALNYLHHEYYASLKRVCPYLDKSREPGSFYFRVN